MKSGLKINPPIELTSAQKRVIAKRKRELEAAIEEGRKGPFYPLFSLKQFLKEARKRYPELTK